MARIAYSTELALEICKRMLDRDVHGSPRSIKEISGDDDMPKERTIYDWIAEHEDFAQSYARAREAQAHMCAAQIIEIADTEEDAAKARNRIDARKWYAAKLNVKHYGDKIDVGGNLGITLSDEQLDARVAQLFGKAGIALASRGEGTPEGSS